MSILLGFGLESHHGYKQYGLDIRETDFENATEYSVDEMIKMGCKAIFSTGDFLNSKRPSSRTIQFLYKLEKKLHNAGVVLYILSGNHDYCKPTWFEVIEENLEDSAIKSIDNQLVDIDGFTVYGFPYFDKTEFLAKKGEIPKADVLLCHIACKEFTQYPSETAISVDDIDLKNHTFVFIGDTHVNKAISKHWEDNRQTMIISPGSNELNSDSEDINKYFYTVEKSDTNQFKHTKHDVKTRKLIRLNIETAEDLEVALEFIKKEKKNAPLLIGKYNNELEDVAQKIHKICKDSEIINHLKPFPPKDKLIVSCIESEIKRPVQYVEEYFSPESLEASLLATILTNPSVGREVIEDFVEKKRASLKISA